jgi:hypothetical protein
MGRFSERGLFVYTGVAAVIFVALLALVPDRSLVPILNSIFLGVAVATYITFAPLIWRAIRQTRFDRVSQLATGVVLMTTSCVVSRFANALSRMDADVSVAWVANSWIVALSGWLGIVAAILFVTAPGMVEERWVYNRRLLAAGWTIGLAIAAVMIYLQNAV